MFRYKKQIFNFFFFLIVFTDLPQRTYVGDLWCEHKIQPVRLFSN